MRTIVDLPPDHVEALDVHCRRENISRAEAVRRAVAAYLRDQNHSAAERAYGLWRDRRLDGLKYQQALRREWDK
jgi:metal-responsive CopG/Arc/MetJ family transcriptional regulator